VEGWSLGGRYLGLRAGISITLSGLSGIRSIWTGTAAKFLGASQTADILD